ncbi:lipopolysaccharide biosynthesis protein [Pseudoalteromonas aurantia]|uniref:Polysaccharide biosynthesis protein C-terminal domain-containing protein n=1 Tax=Pseudoalteromonas aurantia 208 TaxID=1314867 RepID=A0ABR9EEU2_9GAMM|nr:oligosaccharide flippase family protein [Pseudoalteromonas aurantia]MBE0369287.1 hypothetical protein [Pseudoalteromonas aurantia 208]
MSYKSLIKNASAPLLIKIFTALLGFVFNWLLTQQLTSSDFGMVALYQLTLLAIVTLSKFGIDQAFVKLCAINCNLYNIRYFVLVCYIITLLGILFLIQMLVYGIGLFPHLTNNLVFLDLYSHFLLLCCFATSVTTINAGILKGLKHASLFASFNGFVSLTIATLYLLLFKVSSIHETFTILTISLGMSAFLSLCFIARKLPSQYKQLPVSKYTEFTHSTLSFWVAAIVFLVIQQSGSLLLSLHANLQQLGVFIIVIKLAALPSIFLFALNSVLAPKFAAFNNNNQHTLLQKHFEQSQRVLIIIAIVMNILCYGIGSHILALFGEHFREGYEWLCIILIGQSVNLITGPAITLLAMSGNERIHRNISILSGLLTVIIGAVLVTQYGPLGAAITTASAMTLQNTFSYLYVKTRVLNIKHDFTST